MRHKCSLVHDARLVAALVTFVACLTTAGCAGTGSATTAEPPDADTTEVATGPDTTAGDTTPPAPTIPTTIPRPGRVTQQEPAAAIADRPAYAQVQRLPALSTAFASQFGVDDGADWAQRVGRGIVRFSGCSGVLVSPRGLAITSAKCLLNASSEVGTAIAREAGGLFLADMENDQTIDGLHVTLLTGVRDVTGRVDSVLAADPGLDLAAARTRVASELASQAGVQSVRTSVGDDGQTYAYLYEEVSDVRLVFIPEPELADFGGSFDAGSFPQFKLNVAFVRLYESGQPRRTPDHFVWSDEGAVGGDVVYAVGLSDSSSTGSDAPMGVAPLASGGRVNGFRYDATATPPITVFHGLYDHFHAFGPASAWTLPAAWRTPPPDLDLRTPLTMAATAATTMDMLGGAILGDDLTYRGTIYDLTTEAAPDSPGGFRAVAVQTAAIAAVLDVAYNAEILLNELQNSSSGN